MGNTEFVADGASTRPTLEDAARRLLAALDNLTAGTEVAGFHGWENGRGEPAGDQVEEARLELEALLTGTQRPLTWPDRMERHHASPLR